MVTATDEILFNSYSDVRERIGFGKSQPVILSISQEVRDHAPTRCTDSAAEEVGDVAGDAPALLATGQRGRCPARRVERVRAERG